MQVLALAETQGDLLRTSCCEKKKGRLTRFKCEKARAFPLKPYRGGYQSPHPGSHQEAVMIELQCPINSATGHKSNCPRRDTNKAHPGRVTAQPGLGGGGERHNRC